MQNSTNTPLSSEHIAQIIGKLLCEIGYAEPAPTCHRIRRGGNNQAFRVESKHGIFFAKQYFQSPADPRDRLFAEFSFMRFCNDMNIKRVSRALSCDKENKIALYSWVDGEVFAVPKNEHGKAQHVTAKHMREATAFLEDLVQASSADAHNIQPAADACFSLSDHLQSLARRIKNVQENFVEEQTNIEKRAFAILEDRIIPHWQAIKAELTDFCAIEDGKDVDAWILSPSDFGFHNAVYTEGAVTFLDFEYAGKDGPVKTLCDFVCQPAFPVPALYLPELASAVYKDTGKAQKLVTRVQILLPVCRLKWCCIMLNHFTRLGLARRCFANDIDMQAQQKIQLGKVQNYIKHYY